MIDRCHLFVGGYSDIESWYAGQGKSIYISSAKSVKNETKSEKTSPTAKASPRKAKKLSYKDQRELDNLPALIEKLEKQVEEQQTLVNDPEFFKQGSEQTSAVLNALAESEEQLSQAYARWDELESMLED